MGLDIFLYKIVERETDTQIVNAYDSEDCMKELFKLYKSKKMINEYLNIEGYINSCGFDYSDIERYKYSYDRFTFYDPNGKEHVTELKNIPLVKIHEEYFDVVEIKYQRKNMSDEFYYDYLHKGVDVFWIDDQLNEIKKYCNKGAQMLNWKLNDNEFIHMDW